MVDISLSTCKENRHRKKLQNSISCKLKVLCNNVAKLSKFTV